MALPQMAAKHSQKESLETCSLIYLIFFSSLLFSKHALVAAPSLFHKEVLFAYNTQLNECAFRCKSLFTVPFFFLMLFRAAPMVYGGSQARGRMNWSYGCRPQSQTQQHQIWAVSSTYSSQQHRILNPLSKARDQSFVLMDASWIHFHWATMGTPIMSPILASPCI